MALKIKRIYEPAVDDDGFRVLVDRLWPRGLSKKKAGVDLWLKDVAPSAELRKWFNHDQEKFVEFRKKYEGELSDNDALASLKETVKEHQTVTLLYSAKSEDMNQAVILRQLLQP
ncbi:MAG TPA: DUF488 domain-containing protein [Arthrobacter sp.]|nr:DUF488 domain-containing protein [Arthrobacter sp.]